eukprot:10433791-Alexandrium_andersonii.AAC.1
MSASLVGSEMCIRDSPSLRHPSLVEALSRRGPREGGEEAHKRGRRREAVSYTHLTLPTICSV